MKLKVVSGIMLTLLLISMLTLAFNIDGECALADSGWNIETVDTGEFAWTSLALDSGDNPRISYYDDSNNDLKYAYYETPQPVGGVWVPVDKFGVLAPYIAVVGTIILALSMSVAIIKHRKKQ